MKNNKCLVCSQVKGKRGCQLNNNALICSYCCAQARCQACEGCRYYAQSEQYAQDKAKKFSRIKQLLSTIFNPEVDEILFQALAMIKSGNIAEGEEIISELLQKHPNLATVHYAMGVVCQEKNQYDEAITYFDKTVEMFPYFIEAWFNKGACHQIKLEVEETLKAYQKVIELGEPEQDIVCQAKDFLAGFEKTIYEEAGISLDMYQKAKEQFKIAYMDMQNRKYEKAITGFQMVTSMNPKLSQAYGNIGICYAYLGYKQEALDALDKALQIEPQYEPAIHNRIIIASLKEGEKLSEKMTSVDYLKDYSVKGKSLWG